MVLELNAVSRRYRATQALTDVNLAVLRGELLSIVGPSGAGKSTLLRVIAGLEQPDAGAMRAHDAGRIVMVFQDYQLFPALTALQNVAFGLRAAGVPRAAAHAQSAEFLEHFGIAEKADAFPAELSAGQRQRVALARALIIRPAVLLLDEPFANLDRSLKAGTAAFIRRTQREFDLSVIMVTHDLDEAFPVSDRMGIMLGGRLLHCAPPHELYFNPVDEAAARFMGPVNRVESAKFRDRITGLPELPAVQLIRPERLAPCRDAAGVWMIDEVRFEGSRTRYRVRSGEDELLVQGAFGMSVGELVVVQYGEQ